MTNLIELLDKPENLSQEQEQLIHLMQGHITLQNQFEQLTKHVEHIYTRLNAMEKLLQSKVLA